MIREYYASICRGEEIRANLLALREALKEEKNLRAFAYQVGGDFSVLSNLLEHGDPKVRKNAALLLGKMESEDLLPVLMEAYQKETTRFVKPDYLKAMEQMDYLPVLPQLEKRLSQLRSMETLPEEQKHISEEIRVLQAMVLRYKKPERHVFTGAGQKETVILVTNREQREATARQIHSGEITMLRGGLRVQNADLREILSVRTWSELLFLPEVGTLPADDPVKAGRILGGATMDGRRSQGNAAGRSTGISGLMERLHSKTAPWLFRIELKSQMEPQARGTFIRKISDALEKESGGAWINSVTDYEVELRLVERKDRTLAVMLKLYTILDRRFSYRRELLPSSIAPVNAALVVELARPYLKENAQILDPFCGVGTMLIERTKAVPARVMYGIDLLGEAIEKARRNTEAAHCTVHYINRDFFSFTHEYRFDEIITDLPQVTAARPVSEIRSLYGEFLRKAGEHLAEGAVLVLYATEPQFVHESVRRSPEYRIREEYRINEKNHTSVFILQYSPRENDM